jgi:hypothetical protein
MKKNLSKGKHIHTKGGRRLYFSNFFIYNWGHSVDGKGNKGMYMASKLAIQVEECLDTSIE